MKWKALLPIIILITFSLIVRIVYAQFRPDPAIVTDSFGYYSIGAGILENPKPELFINKYRTPGYPVFIAGITKLTTLSKQLTREDLYSASTTIVWIQIIFGILSVLLCYVTLQVFNVSKSIAFVTSILISGNIFVFGWERTILTDSLSFFLLTLTI
ncbi:hypothetical protein ACFL1P_01265, partial [Patescibacteria group bacterium]